MILPIPYFYIHLTDKETATQRGLVIGPRSHSHGVADQTDKPVPPHLAAHQNSLGSF